MTRWRFELRRCDNLIKAKEYQQAIEAASNQLDGTSKDSELWYLPGRALYELRQDEKAVVEWALRDSNPRPHGCDAEGTPIDPQGNSPVAPTPPAVCTQVCTSNSKTSNETLDALAAALRALSANDRALLAAMLVKESDTDAKERDRNEPQK